MTAIATHEFTDEFPTHVGQMWTDICDADLLQPERAVAALVDGRQVAVVLLADGAVYAVGHHDPYADANVMARGIVGSVLRDGQEIPTRPSASARGRSRSSKVACSWARRSESRPRREAETGVGVVGEDFVPHVLTGQRVLITAHRRATELAAALERRGAEVVHSPIMTIVPHVDDALLLEATRELVAHPPQVVVVTTGVGLRGWIEAADAAGVADELLKVPPGSSLVGRRLVGRSRRPV
jgi:Rieske 2Fe-2S protein/uroporphyrinogen-III synthase HemD